MMELEKELKQKMEEITPIDRQVMEAAWKTGMDFVSLCEVLAGWKKHWSRSQGL